MRVPQSKCRILSGSISSILFLNAFALLPATGKATSDVWDGSTDGVWSRSTNWLTDPAIVPGIGDTATFNGAGNGFTTIDLGLGVRINRLVFDTVTAAAYTMGAGAIGSQTLTLDNGGGIVVNATVTNNEFINANVLLGNDGSAQTFDLINQSSAAGQRLTIAGGLSGSNGAGTKTLAIGGAGSILISGVISDGATGTVTLTKNNGGILTLSGANSHTGGITLNAGTLNVNNSAALGNTQPGALTINGGTLDNTTGAAIITTVAKAMSWNGDFTFAGTRDLSTNLGAVTIGGAAGSRTVTVSNGVLSTGVWTAGAGIGLTKAGAGALFMANTANTSNIAGALDIQAGKIQVAGDLTVGGLTGSGTIENGGAASKWLFVNNAVDNTFSGTIQGNPSIAGARLGLVKRGTGTLHLTGSSNTYADNFAIENGTVRITGINNVGGTGLGQANIGNVANQSGVLFVDGGTLNASKTNAPSLSVGTVANSRGVLRMDSGVLNSASEMWVGSAAGGYGSLRLSGGTLSVGNWFAVGRNGNGVVNMSGGTLNVTGQNYTNGSFGGALGVTNLSGGTVNVTNVGANQGGFLVAEAGGGILNMSGSAALNISGARGLHVAINGGTGIVNLGGGVVTTPLVQKGTSDGTVNFHGGTLRASAASANYMSGLTAAYVYGEGGIIDTNGNAITIAQPLLAPTGSGITAAGLTVTGSGFIDTPIINVIGSGIGATALGNVDGNGNLTGITITNPGVNYTTDPITFEVVGGGGTGGITGTPTLVPNSSGGLTKIGAGTLTLSGANTYGGATNVNAGILRASNATGSATGTGPVNVNIGGALSGTGTISGIVNVASGGTVSPADAGGVGTISLGGLTLNAGSILTYEWDVAQNHDQILVTGSNALTISGGRLNLLNAGGSTVFSSNGVYNLIGFTGNITGNPSNLSVDPASMVAGKNYIFGASNGFVTLLITPPGVTPNFWNVNADGLWTTGSNWTLNTAPNATQAFANFGGGGTPITAARTVTLDANQTVGSVAFNSSQSFTIAGGNTLTLNNGSDPATISVTGGSHTIGVAMSAVSGGVQFNAINTADVLTVSGPLAGAANVTKIGSGTVTLSGANSYTGTTTLNLGTLTISGSGTLGNTGNPLAVNGASLNLGGTTQTVGATTISGGSITNGTLRPSSLTYDGTAATTISAAISGSGGVSKNGTGTLTLTGNNSHTGGTTLSAGTLVITNNNSLGGAGSPVTFNGGALTIQGTGATDLGTRSVTGFPALIDVVEGGHTFTIGQSFDAIIAFVKRGLGRLMLSGNNNFAAGPAPLTVNSGILEIGGGITSDTAAGNSPIQIANEADATATLTVSGTATLNSGTSEIYVGQGFATANGILNLRDSGTINVGNWLAVGRANAVGTVNMSGGTLNKLGGNGNHVTIGANTATSTGSFFQSGGIINSADSDFFVGESGIGTYAISGTAQANLLVLRLGVNGTGNGTVHLNGGTINAAQVVQGAGASSFNFNGGTLRPVVASADFVGATVATNVLEGGAIIDTNGVNVTINASLSSGAASDGGLRKRGAGTLTLTATNAYTGPTVIEAGTLAVTGTIAGSASITVQQNATLDVNPAGMSLANAQTLRGNGTVTGVMRLTTGSKLAPGEGVGTLTFTSDLDIAQAVAPAASAALVFEISSTSDKALLTAGALTIGTGVLGFGDFTFNNAGGVAEITYTLFDSIVPVNGTLDAANLSGPIPGGFFGTLGFADNGHDIVLQVVPEPMSAALLAVGVASLLGLRRPRGTRQRAFA